MSESKCPSVSLSVRPATMGWRPMQGAHRLSPPDSRGGLQQSPATQKWEEEGTENGCLKSTPAGDRQVAVLHNRVSTNPDIIHLSVCLFTWLSVCLSIFYHPYALKLFKQSIVYIVYIVIVAAGFVFSSLLLRGSETTGIVVFLCVWVRGRRHCNGNGELPPGIHVSCFRTLLNCVFAVY